MTKEFSRWLGSLINSGLLEQYNISHQRYLRLSGFVRFVIPGDKVRELMRQYDANTERGGFLVAMHSIQNEQTTLTVTDIIFVENVSPNPRDSYQFHKQQAMIAVSNAFSSKQFPFVFHTHPTNANSFLLQIKEYKDQIETSLPDQIAASNAYLTEHGKLLLPEALIVCPGSVMKGIFVGLYGGLIAPLDFKKQKYKLLYSSILNTSLDTLSLVNNPKDAVIATGIGLGISVGFKQLSPLNKRMIGETILLLSLVAYADPGEPPIYFAMSAGNRISIDLPKPADNEINKQKSFIDNNFC